MLLVIVACPRAGRAQPATPNEPPRLTVHGFVSATVFANDQEFGLGNGQNAMWAALPELERDPWFHGGDVRNTRLTLAFNGSELMRGWRANATLELDLFGGFTGQGTFSDQQPNPRLRLAFVDLTNGRTTLRIGQNWSPTFGYALESLSHIGFPPGWGSGGLIGWRFPGVFLYQDLTSGGTNTLQLQVAAMRGSFSDLDKPDDVSAGEATLRPQLEVRLDFKRRPAQGPAVEAFVAAHYDHKDLSGPGNDVDDSLDSWAANGGVRVRRGRVTWVGNGYRGKAIGHLFAQILQFGDFKGWGAQGQVGYAFAPNWSLWALYGIDDPDDTNGPDRLRNQVASAMVRWKVREYALGLEWFHAKTDWRVLSGGRTAVAGNQIALSVRFDF